MAKFAMFVGSTAIEAAIGSVAKKGATLQALMHKTAVSILNHVSSHGDIRHVDRFISAMPKSARTNALIMWFVHFGPLDITVADGKNVVTFVKGKTVDLDAAIAKPFWDFKANEGGDYTAIDPIALLVATIKKLETDEQKAKVNHAATIGVLQLQIDALKAAKAAKAPVLQIAYQGA